MTTRPDPGRSRERFATTDLFLVAFCLVHPWYSGREVIAWHRDMMERVD